MGHFCAWLLIGARSAGINRFPSGNYWGQERAKPCTPRDADPRRWGLIVNIENDALSPFENSKLMKRWNKKTLDHFEGTLKPIAVHGKWSKKNPFKSEIAPIDWNGKVVAITRARIKWRKNFCSGVRFHQLPQVLKPHRV